MKKIPFLLLLIVFSSTRLTFSQTKKDTVPSPQFSVSKGYDINHEYIVAGNIKLTQCGPVGEKLENALTVIAYKGYTFNIMKVDRLNGDMAIQFLPFKDSVGADGKTKELSYKGKIFNNKYFLLSQSDMAAACKDNTDSSKWNLSYGALVIPFKFRPTKGLFTNNLNLGSSVYFQYQCSKDLSNGVVVGISLSSVTLDSLSTNYKVKTGTDRPAFTPSVSYVISYKNISFTAGFGTDIINKTSVVEKSWIFNGKPWIGFGIGINLFTPGTDKSKTEASDDQKTKADTKKGT